MCQAMRVEAAVTVGDFTFWISLSLSPQTDLTPEFWSQSEVRISWAKTGAKIATE